MEIEKDINQEIEEIFKIIKQQKKIHLLQTNINEREDLAQEIDILIYRKLQMYLRNQPPTLYQYLKSNETKYRVVSTKSKGSPL